MLETIKAIWSTTTDWVEIIITDPEFSSLKLYAIPVLAFIFLWASYSASNKWRNSTFLRRLIVLVTAVVLALSITYASHNYQVDGVATVALSLVAAFVFWQITTLSDHQRKFLDHDEKMISVFEQSHGLNREARQLHIITLMELKNAQARLAGRFDNDGGFYADAYASKYKQICSQIVDHQVYVRDAEFKELWKKLVDISTSYTSVCDLSFYADVTVRAGDQKSRQLYEREHRYWTGRVRREIEELIRKKKTPQTFHKVIVYAPLKNYDDPAEIPPCNTPGNKCVYLNCHKKCIVKTVTQMWKDAESRFEANVEGLAAREKGGRHLPFIWLVHKEEIDSKFLAINTANGSVKEPSLDSVDVGLFDDFVGEEFKVPAGTGEARVQDYLARIRFAPELAKRINEACRELREDHVLRSA